MNDRIRAYYDERYGDDALHAFPEDLSRYRTWLGSTLRDVQPGSAVLDYGCGVGYVCSMFADLGCDVTGVDISHAALEIAREREPRARFLKAAADGSLPLGDRSLDLVVCLGVLEHIPSPERVVAELRRVSRDDAAAVWVVPNARSPFFWFGHGTGQVEEHPRPLDGWRELLASGGWIIEDVRRDPGPIDRPIAGWKRLGQGILSRLPMEMTYQFVIETRPS